LNTVECEAQSKAQSEAESEAQSAATFTVVVSQLRVLPCDFDVCELVYNSINKGNYQLINPCSFDVGELVPQCAVVYIIEIALLDRVAAPP
jgi:hypothetical protein